MIWTVLAVMVYAAIAGAVIYGLLVAAWKHCETVEPWAYVFCGALWPIAALPALGVILAEKKINEIQEGQQNGKQ